MITGLQRFGDAKTLDDLKQRIQKEFDYLYQQISTLHGRIVTLEGKVTTLETKTK